MSGNPFGFQQDIRSVWRAVSISICYSLRVAGRDLIPRIPPRSRTPAKIRKGLDLGTGTRRNSIFSLGRTLRLKKVGSREARVRTIRNRVYVANYTKSIFGNCADSVLNYSIQYSFLYCTQEMYSGNNRSLCGFFCIRVRWDMI